MSGERQKASYLRPETPASSRKRSRVPATATKISFEEDRRNVYLRIKPTKAGKNNSFVTLDEFTVAPVPNDSMKIRKGISQQYKFTKIFGPKCQQEEIFKETCISPLNNFLHGGNCLVFAYGATNAGKTFTIQGSAGDPGIIPRSLNLLFNSIKGRISEEIKLKPDKINNVLWLTPEQTAQELELKKSILNFHVDKNKVNRSVSTLSSNSETSQLSTDSSVICPYFHAMRTNLGEEAIEIEEDATNVYSVWVSYAEIYNENIYDLLSSSKLRKPLVLGENNMKEVYIKDLTDICVFSAEEAFKVFMFGQHNLHQASTSINHVSSRSHSIFSVKLVRHMKIDCPAFARLSMCTFVDLAGAERAKKTKNAGERMKESQSINTSLHVLGKCFDVVRHNQKNRENMTRMLPCRESKLTRLFQRALEGREVLTMIVNITTDEKLFDETLNVLKFSAMARELQFDQLPDTTFCSLRRSRFSLYMEKFSSILQTSMEGIEEVPEDDRYMKLLAYIEELKKAVEEEKKKNMNIEIQIRKEAYTHFRKIIVNMEDMYKQRLNDQRDEYAEYEERIHHRLQSYCNNNRKRRRKSQIDSEDDDDEEEDEDEEEDSESEAGGSQEQIRFLKNKVEALTGLVEDREQVKEAHTSLQAKYSKLQCEFAMVKQELESALKIHKEMGQEEHVKELNEQLAEYKNALKERNTEFEMLKKLVEDAKAEYIEHFQEHEDFAARNAELMKMIAERDMKIEDLQMQIDICNKKLNEQQQNSSIREFEEAEYEVKLQVLREARDEYKFKVGQLESDLKKLQIENKKLKNQPQAPSNNDNDVKALELLLASHEDKLKKYEEKIMKHEKENKELKESMSILSAQSFTNNPDSYEKEISILQIEVKESVQSKKELKETLEKTTKELKETIEALRLAEKSLTDEQSNTKAMRRICESEKNDLEQELQQIKFTLHKLQKECEKLSSDNNILKLQNMELEESLKVKEDQMEAFKRRRDAQFETYENLLKHERELREREQREVHQMHNVMRVHTPKRSEYLAEISKLKEQLKDALMKVSEIKKEYQLNNIDDISNKKSDVDDSFHKPRPKTRNTRRQKSEKENLKVSQEEIHCISSPEIAIKPEPDTRQLRSRRKKAI